MSTNSNNPPVVRPVGVGRVASSAAIQPASAGEVQVVSALFELAGSTSHYETMR
ncbi:hypothetical protein [Nocardia brasiliensis]|uniref:hypothetical protein n=1 Tax=Nocardia brasiliensis TaxID=37326 RepID=UPI0024565D21|nr:hypothetical protein [Nocardia brasiliensis]